MQNICEKAVVCGKARFSVITENLVRCEWMTKGDFSLYEDNGISRGYENGEYLKTKFSYENKKGIITVKIEPFGKGYEGMPKMRSYRIELMNTEKLLTVLNDVQCEIKFKTNLSVVQIREIPYHESVQIILG